MGAEETIAFAPERVIGREVSRLPSVDSTNEECKRRYRAGKGDGLAVVADEQTKGKGRRGRSFQSLAGQGLYLSALLPLRTGLQEAAQLTAWSAVAARRAIGTVAGLQSAIKWPNDLTVDGKKLCGILTEALEGAVVVGIGIDLRQTAEDFGPELAPIATSLLALGYEADREALAQALLNELDAMYRAFPQGREDYLREYRAACVTLGKPVRLLRPDGAVRATALDVDERFALQVELEDGTREAVTFGEVSLRAR